MTEFYSDDERLHDIALFVGGFKLPCLMTTQCQGTQGEQPPRILHVLMRRDVQIVRLRSEAGCAKPLK